VKTTSVCAILAFCAAFAISASSARAEFYVPPSNSAVNQYTQNEPSAGGDRAARKKPVVPAEALGDKNAKKLEKQGAAGKAAAELAADTDPRSVEAETSAPEPTPIEGPEATNSDAGNHPQAHQQKRKKAKAPTKNAHDQGHPQKAAPPLGGGDQPPAAAAAPGSSGASASGEVVSHATGLSGADLGVFLPLVIIAAIAGAIAFVLRNRRHNGRSVA
jgi:hypothetical protein